MGSLFNVIFKKETPLEAEGEIPTSVRVVVWEGINRKVLRIEEVDMEVKKNVM